LKKKFQRSNFYPLQGFQCPFPGCTAAYTFPGKLHKHVANKHDRPGISGDGFSDDGEDSSDRSSRESSEEPPQDQDQEQQQPQHQQHQQQHPRQYSSSFFDS